jgi:light-regulated signal transduction histidine kinase (bacteriophytochrome)
MNDIWTERNVTFMNLDPGKYILLVQACNNDGVWNPNPASLEITIFPPFWHSWWFRLIISLSAISLIVTLYKFRTRTIRKRNELLDQLVIKRTRQLETANKELEAFTYSVSHDLRAPLRSINGFSHVLAEEKAEHLDEEGHNVLMRIQSATKHMAHLIDDLLKLSRISLSEIKYETVDLSQLTHKVVNELIENKTGLKDNFIIQSDLLISGDARLLQIMVNNLISNAIKFTGKTKEPRIEFGEITDERNSRKVHDGKRVFFVADNGAGFDNQFANKIFDPFQRLHTASEFEGTGIGLAIVRRIINKHGGSIWAEGKINQGAKFYFTLR